MCNITGCEYEFPTLKEMLSHERDPQAKHGKIPEIPQVKAPVVKPPVVVEKKAIVVEKVIPIELKYRYQGQCPVCRTEVETLEVDMNEELLVIAYCLQCRKNLLNKMVPKLG